MKAIKGRLGDNPERCRDLSEFVSSRSFETLGDENSTIQMPSKLKGQFTRATKTAQIKKEEFNSD
jgi:hypothetical protein